MRNNNTFYNKPVHMAQIIASYSQFVCCVSIRVCIRRNIALASGQWHLKVLVLHYVVASEFV